MRIASGPVGQSEKNSSSGTASSDSGAASVYSPLIIADVALGKVELVLLGLALFTLCLIALIQGVMSLFSETPHWQAELIRACVLMLTMLGGAYAAHSKRMISMDIVSRAVKGAKGAWVTQVVRLGVIFVCLASGHYANKLVPIKSAESVLPQDFVYKLLPLGFVLIAIHLVLHFLIDLGIMMKGELPEVTEGGAH